MKFWDDGQPNSTRTRNVLFCWKKLKELTSFLKQNGIICDAFLYDFSPEKIIDEAIHIPYPLGVYKKAEKTNIILENQKSFDFIMMIDCDAFFDKDDYFSLLEIIKSLSLGDVITFDLAKLKDNLHEYIQDDVFLKEKADWSYAYSGDRKNGPLLSFYGSLGGVYICDIKLLLELGGFNEKYKGWGGEDGDMFARIQCSNIPHTFKPTRTFSPFHISHFCDVGNPNYIKRFDE